MRIEVPDNDCKVQERFGFVRMRIMQAFEL